MFKKNLCRGKDNLDIAKKELLGKKEFRASLVLWGFFFLLILSFRSWKCQNNRQRPIQSKLWIILFSLACWHLSVQDSPLLSLLVVSCCKLLTHSFCLFSPFSLSLSWLTPLGLPGEQWAARTIPELEINILMKSKPWRRVERWGEDRERSQAEQNNKGKI